MLHKNNQFKIGDIASANQKLTDFRKELRFECNSVRKWRMAVMEDYLKNVVKNRSLPPGAYKLRLIPEQDEGSPYIFICNQMRLSDVLGFKVIKDEKEDIYFVSYRHKDASSLIETERKEMGARPFQPLLLKHAAFESVQTKISDTLLHNQDKISPESISDLKHLSSFISERAKERDKILAESCLEGQAGMGLLRQSLSEISQLIIDINSLKDERQKCALPPKHLPVSTASLWPMSAYDAKEIAESIPVSCKEFFLDWISRYTLAMKKSLGVGALEYSSYDLMRDLDYAIMRAGLESGKPESFGSKHESFMFTLKEVRNTVMAIDRKMQALYLKPTYAAVDLVFLCELGEMRRKVLESLASLYESVGAISHFDHNSSHLKAIVATMSVNLCKIDSGEMALWKELAESSAFSSIISNYKNYLSKRCMNSPKRARRKELKRQEKEAGKIKDRIKTFATDAAKESESLRRMQNEASINPFDYSGKSKEMEQQLIDKIISLEKISPAVYSIISGAYASSKSHMEYKFGGKLCHDPYHYLTPSELLFTLSELDPQGAFNERLANHLQANARLFGILEKHGLRSEILGHIDPLLHLKEKAFDLDTDPISHKEKGYRGNDIQLHYRIGVDPDSNSQVIHYRDGQMIHSIALPEPANSSPSSKSISENFYGDKFDLGFIIELQGQTVESLELGQIYSKINEIASRDLPAYREIQARIRSQDLSTAHFLSTFTAKKKISGCVSNLGDNPPRVLDEHTNTFLSALRERYQSYNKDNATTTGYTLQKTNIRIFRELNRTLPYWVLACAERIAKQSQPDASSRKGFGIFSPI